MIIPSISIIIPVYNQEKWIGRCLRSLISQTLDRSKYEIIVIDDGSKDKTNFALGLFSDEIVLINNEKNIGLPASLNKGIKLSKAKYILRVDGDDYVNESFLSLLYQFIEQNKYMDAVSCDYLTIDDNEKVLSRENCIESPIGCGIIFKSSQLFEIGLYDEDFELHEERDLRHRFEKKYSIHRLELPLYRYRRHQNNITNNEKKMKSNEKKLKLKHGI